MTSTRRRLRGREPEPEAAPETSAEPALHPSLLVAPELLARGSQVARVAAARDAQLRFGNHAVSQVLARDPNPSLEKRPAVRPPKPKLRTGREVDAIFDTSPYFKDLVGERMKKVTLAKAMKVDDEDQFEAAWVEYAMRSYNPQTEANYTEEDARRYLATKGVRAFQDEDRGVIHIRRSRADLGTQLHEGLHLFSDDGWKRPMGYNANEGVTEWFTRKIGPEVGVERDDSSFLQQYTSATHLIAAAGEAAVAAAYFEGDVAGLEKKIDGRRADAAGTWKRWLRHLDAGEYKAANALLQ
jgi:hypothetical protein